MFCQVKCVNLEQLSNSNKHYCTIFNNQDKKKRMNTIKFNNCWSTRDMLFTQHPQKTACTVVHTNFLTGQQ